MADTGKRLEHWHLSLALGLDSSHWKHALNVFLPTVAMFMFYLALGGLFSKGRVRYQPWVRPITPQPPLFTPRRRAGASTARHGRQGR